MSEPYIGEIRSFPYDFAPRGWAQCAGQLMAITDNPALFSLLGTTYGGNGTTTFGLPDYRGRTPLGWGQATWRNFPYGDRGGEEFQILSIVATHTHEFNVVNKEANQRDPTNRFVCNTISDDGGTPYATQANITLVGTMVATAGTQSPNNFNNIQPYLVLNMCIALEGTYPPRN